VLSASLERPTSLGDRDNAEWVDSAARTFYEAGA
jgi:hypothetical protein